MGQVDLVVEVHPVGKDDITLFPWIVFHPSFQFFFLCEDFLGQPEGGLGYQADDEGFKGIERDEDDTAGDVPVEKEVYLAGAVDEDGDDQPPDETRSQPPAEQTDRHEETVGGKGDAEKDDGDKDICSHCWVVLSVFVRVFGSLAVALVVHVPGEVVGVAVGALGEEPLHQVAELAVGDMVVWHGC